MKKIILLAALGLVIAIGVFLFFVKPSAPDLLGKNIELFAYTANGNPLGGGVISIPFIKDAAKDGARYVQVAVDINKNGQYEENEWVAKNVPARIFKDYRNNFPVSFKERRIDTTKPQKVLALLTTSTVAGDPKGSALESVEAEAEVKTYEVAEILGLNVAGAREDLKRGPGPVFVLPSAIIYAQGEGEQSASRNANVPDLPQGSMECSAVATANNLISLAGEHGALDQLPQNTRDLVEEIKTDMQFNNGIVNGNFKTGKDAFVARHNLPIVTRRISNPSFEDLMTALNSGGAVELSTRMVQSASGMASTGHTMTLVGANQSSSGGQSVQVHDSASPPGADTFSVGKARTPSGQEFVTIEYPLWDGAVIVDDIFVQNWVEPEHAATGDQTSAGEDTSRVEMLVINGSYFPRSQFHVAGPDVCDADHYHGGRAFGLRTKTGVEIVSMSDPNPGACGFGRVSEVPVEWVDLTLEQSTELLKNIDF